MFQQSKRISYVGFDDKGHFNLPLGISVDDAKENNPVANLFFCVKRFSDNFSGKIKKSYSEPNPHAKGAGTSKDNPKYGRSLNNFPAPSFPGLNAAWELIEQLSSTRVLALIKARGLTQQIDYSKSLNQLHRANFLPDGTPLFDRMLGNRKEIRAEGSEIVELAC